LPVSTQFVSTALSDSHQDPDRAVDRCYPPEPFLSDRHPVEYLFALSHSEYGTQDAPHR
jgi:hypothetical protein